MVEIRSLSVESLTGSTDEEYSSGPRNCNRRILYLLIFCVLVIIGLIAALATVASKGSKDNGNNSDNVDIKQDPKVQNSSDTCRTKECVKAAAIMIQSMDDKVHPCDDFFKFACGGWQKARFIPDDSSLVSTFSELRFSVALKVKAILEESVKDADWEAVIKAKRYYQSCMNIKAVEDRNLDDIVETISDLEGWPVTKRDWNASNFNLEDIFIKVKRYTLSPPIFSMKCGTDLLNPGTRILEIGSPAFGMPDESYFLKERDHPVLLAYENFAVQMAVMFGADPLTARNETRDMVDFEILLVNAVKKSLERRDETESDFYTTIRGLSYSYKMVDWKKYFEGVINKISPSMTFQIDEDEKVLNLNPDYFKELMNIFDITPSRTIANYIVWRVIKSFVFTLPERVRELERQYTRLLTGTKKEVSRWETCVEVTNFDTTFGLAVGKPFVENHFGPEAKADVHRIINHLKASMKNLISNNDWMDYETKIVAKEKVDYMEPMIGYPDEMLIKSELNKEYELINVNPETYYKNTINIVISNVIKNLMQLREPVDRSKWTSPPASVNAFYVPTKNQILFPAGILQPPFYNKDYPNYLNYGGIGFSIGHEVTHGFDNSGRRYDKSGDLKQWWTEMSKENFLLQSECMVTQYGRFIVEGTNMTLNGILTLNENIADNGGIKDSFWAYRKSIASTHNGMEELLLPGLNLTANQMFYLKAAQIFCEEARPERALELLRTDPHSNGKSRVNGPFQNFEEFSRAFNCPVGSFMNPWKKCSVW